MLSTETRSAAATEIDYAPSRSPRIWFRLILIACGLQLGYLALWPLSYRLTHGEAFTYQYLTRYEWLWLNLVHPLVQLWERLWPGIAASYETNVNLLLATFVLLFGLYLAAAALVYRAAPQPGVAPSVLGLALVFQLTLFLMPGLFTTDVFSYAMYGHIAGVYQLNPYLHTPGDFPGHVLVDWIHPIWHFAPSVYGPLWVNVSALLSSAVFDRPLVDQVLAFKLLINLVHLANVGLVWLLLARFQPSRRAAGLLLFAWNPLLLFEFAGNAHNDALMLTFLLLSLLLLARQRPGWAMLALACSVWVKYTTALLVPLYLALWLRQHWRLEDRVRVTVLTGLAMAGTALALYLPWLERPDILAPVFEWAQGPMYGNHPPEVIARLVAGWGTMVAGADAAATESTAREVAKLITRVAFLVYFVYEMRRVTSLSALLPAAIRVFAVFLLAVHTWVLAWYWSWPVALAVLLGFKQPLARIMLGFSGSALLVTYSHQYWGMSMNAGTMLIYLAPLLVPGAWALLQWRAARQASRDSLGPELTLAVPQSARPEQRAPVLD